MTQEPLDKKIIPFRYKRKGNALNVEDVKQAIQSTKKKLKDTLEEGVKRNNILPLDWTFDRIDKILKEDWGSLVE